jgi:hypothetical protein
MKIMSVLYTAAALAVGGAVGYNMALDKDYRVNRSGAEVTLESRTLGKEYPLNVVGKDMYLGNSEHNLQGVRVMGIYEGQQSVLGAPAAQGTTTIDDKVAKKSLGQKVGQVGDAAKESWKTFKDKVSQ